MVHKLIFAVIILLSSIVFADGAQKTALFIPPTDQSAMKGFQNLLQQSQSGTPFPAPVNLSKKWRDQILDITNKNSDTPLIMGTDALKDSNLDGTIDGGGGCLVKSSNGQLSFLDFYLFQNSKEKWNYTPDKIEITPTIKDLGVGDITDLNKLSSYRMATDLIKKWRQQGDVLAGILNKTSITFQQVAATKYYYTQESSLCSVKRNQIASGDHLLTVAFYDKITGLTVSIPVFNHMTFTQQVGLWLHEILRNFQIQIEDGTPDATIFAVVNMMIFSEPKVHQQLFDAADFGSKLQLVKTYLNILRWGRDQICYKYRSYSSRVEGYNEVCQETFCFFDPQTNDTGEPFKKIILLEGHTAQQNPGSGFPNLFEKMVPSPYDPYDDAFMAYTLAGQFEARTNTKYLKQSVYHMALHYLATGEVYHFLSNNYDPDRVEYFPAGYKTGNDKQEDWHYTESLKIMKAQVEQIRIYWKSLVKDGDFSEADPF